MKAWCIFDCGCGVNQSLRSRQNIDCLVDLLRFPDSSQRDCSISFAALTQEVDDVAEV